MTIPRCDSEVFSWLRQTLEPEFQVVAFPDAGYRTHLKYCYRILKADEVVYEFNGDFETLEPGALVREAVACVNRLLLHHAGRGSILHSPVHRVLPCVGEPMKGLIAARHPPALNSRTWFSSGRAAFAFLIQDVVRPRRVWLPSFVCWSLVDVMKERFPSIAINYYRVRRDLTCEFPGELSADDALVAIHYFGRVSLVPRFPQGVVLEDVSHLLLNDGITSGDFRFGSLRKVLMLADGGFVDGHWNPVYESASPDIRWLRTAARDWRDLREAENMLDRRLEIGDMSSQSLATLLRSNVTEIAQQRRTIHRYLQDNLVAGRSLVQYGLDDVPMLHCREFESTAERDQIRRSLAAIGVYCSVHWPTHEDVIARATPEAVSDAQWIEQRTLCIPILETTDTARLQEICQTCNSTVP